MTSAMNHITRYIFRQSLGLTVIVTLALSAAIWVISALRMVQLVVDRGDGLGIFFELMVLELPTILQLVVPIGCFIGALFTYNKMIGDSEMVVMRACGLSQSRLALPALLLGGVALLVMFSISVYFLPASKNAFKDLQFAIENQFTSAFLQEGTFNTVSNTLTIYVQTRGAVGELQGLLIFDTRDPQKPVTLTSENGLIVQVDGNPRILMRNGTRGTWDKVKQDLSVLTFDSWTLDLDEFRDAPGARLLQPDERYLPDLFDPQGVDNDPTLKRRLIVEGHNRLASPLYCITYVLVALACLLTGELNRRGQAKRMAVAFVTVMSLVAGSLVTTNLANRTLGAIPLMYLTAIVPGIIGAVLVLFGYRRLVRLLARRPATAATA
jgi:lipopolysaccharide export system permease protein